MKLLLDTHSFIWWVSQPGLLSARALAACQDPTNTLLLSVVSVWEMQIKSQLGRLTLSLPLAEIVRGQQMANSIEVLPIMLAHVLALDTLPKPHKDPFDRLLVAQALVEGATLVTNDPALAQYPVEITW